MEAKVQKEICARIKEARMQAGFTQQEMADLLDLTLRGYQNYENERVPFRRIGEIARLTRVEERWLLYGGGAMAQAEQLEALATVVDLLHSIDEHLVRIERAMPARTGSKRQAEQPRP